MKTTMSSEITDKQGEPVEVGDIVSTKARGGKRVGEVLDIVYTEEEAKERGVKNPPKVLFQDQHGRPTTR